MKYPIYSLLCAAAVLASAGTPVPVTSLSLGGQFGSAVRMAANPGTTRVYVFNSTLSPLAPVAPSIAVVDSSTASLVKSLVPQGVNSMTLVAAGESRNAVKGYAVNPATNKVYVAYSGASGSALVEIDSAIDAITANVPIPGTIVSMAVNPSTNKVYAIASGQLLVFDGNTLAQTSAIGKIENGALVVNTKNNKIYAGSSGGSFAVVTVDGINDLVTAITAIPNDPYDLIVDPVTNNLYAKPNVIGSTPDLSVYEIDGPSNQLAATITSPFSPAVGFGANFDFADAINNKIYSGPVSIDGGSNSPGQGLPAFDFPVGQPPPLTCQASQGLATDFSLANMYTGCDGALLIADTITGMVKQMVPVNFITSWTQIIVNPVTHSVYGISLTTMAIVDPLTLNVKIVSLGDTPGGVAANPITNQVYIVDESLSAAVQVSGANNTIISKIFAQIGGLNLSAFVPQTPVAIAVNKSKNQYVVLGGASGMVFDGATNTPLVPIRPQLFSNVGAVPVGFLFPSISELTNQMYSTDHKLPSLAERRRGGQTGQGVSIVPLRSKDR